MRFSARAILVTLLAAFVAASPIANCPTCAKPPPAGNVSVDQCGNDQTLQCCQDIQKASTAEAQGALGQLSALITAAVDPSANLGLNCNAVAVLGAATGTKCQATTACCSKQNYNGLVVVGCNPINVGV